MSIRNTFVIVLCCLLAACRPSPQFQEHFNIPKNQWTYDFKPVFHFTVDDTAAAYQLLFIIRHTGAYPFNNIWVQLDTKNPGDSVFHPMRIEVPLAAPSGQWMGRGMGEIWEQRVAINTATQPAYFRKKGEYELRLSHEMRRNPLPEVMQVGLRIEKLGIFRRQEQ